MWWLVGLCISGAGGWACIWPALHAGLKSCGLVAYATVVMATKLSFVYGFSGSLRICQAATFAMAVLLLGGCPSASEDPAKAPSGKATTGAPEVGSAAGGVGLVGAVGGVGGAQSPAKAAGAGRQGNPQGGGAAFTGRTVVATTAQIGDIVRNLLDGVPGVTVKVLLGEGVDPHTYKLTRSDAATLHSGDLILFSGLHLEGKMGEVITELETSGKRVVEVGSKIPVAQRLMPEGSAGQSDPHFWMDPELFTFATGVVSREAFAMVSGDLALTELVTENARRYNGALRGLDERVKQLMAEIPPSARNLVTSHDAFGYYGRRYGLKVHAVQGISTESEAGIADVQRLVDLIVTEKIPSVFVESSVSDKTIKAVIEQAAKRGHTVTVGGQLYSDAMGKPGSAEGTYIGMMTHNAETIHKGLGGKGAAAPDAVPGAKPGAMLPAWRMPRGGWDAVPAMTARVNWSRA